VNLATFIESNIDALLHDWVAQAQRLGVAASLAQDVNFEDSARLLLEQIAQDMQHAQSDVQRDAKSFGQLPDNAEGITRIARTHADERLAQGFSLDDVVAEFRALRASVVRHWLDLPSEDATARLNELVRFDESVDQALTESIARYSTSLARVRELFVGILAHDLRTPLGAIAMSAQFLLLVEGSSAPALRVAANIQRSSSRMQHIINDLMDFTRIRLGGLLPVNIQATNVSDVCRQAIGEIEALHPDQSLAWSSSGELSGTWDGGRLSQLLTNLLENAIDHGRPGGTITIVTEGAADTVTLSVFNEGDPIPPEVARVIFDPLKRTSPTEKPRRAGAGLGLGLFIARQIAQAHGGTLELSDSDASGTRFVASLPRAPSQPS
jgi:signal transduction histidine kinase